MTYTLIGMPASGKSCMGRAIARKLNIKNLDTDKLIEKVTGKKLQEIINEEGIEAFEKIEEDTICTLTDEGFVVSTGGSAVYSEKAMRHLKSLGPVIYLYASYNTIKTRLGDFSARGVVLKPGQTLSDLYNERTVLYEKYADITVNCDGNAYPRYQLRLIEEIEKYKKSRKA